MTTSTSPLSCRAMPIATSGPTSSAFILQDKFQVKPNLTFTAGIRYDWDGGLTEKYGRIFNFDPSLYSYISATGSLPVGRDTRKSSDLTQSGFIIAGNNKNGTAGVSNTTLTGRQWGIAPRVGARVGACNVQQQGRCPCRHGHLLRPRRALQLLLAWLCHRARSRRGPFGANQQVPFVTAQSCPTDKLTTNDYIPTCAGGTAGSLEFPYTNVQNPPPTNPKASDFAAYLPNSAAIINGSQPVSLGVYDRRNKLPYSINYTLDLQWQPRNDLAIEVGYVGKVGRHQVIPVPFNQPNIASPSAPDPLAELLLRLHAGECRWQLPSAARRHDRADQLRRRQYRPSRSLYRLRCRVYRLQSGRR